jgi:hypothetical protein
MLAPQGPAREPYRSRSDDSASALWENRSCETFGGESPSDRFGHAYAVSTKLPIVRDFWPEDRLEPNGSMVGLPPVVGGGV